MIRVAPIPLYTTYDEIWRTIQALRDVPVVNARIDGGDVVYHRRVHLGIAVATGFADQSHLTRWFRRTYGITPAVYQRGAATPAHERGR